MLHAGCGLLSAFTCLGHECQDLLSLFLNPTIEVVTFCLHGCACWVWFVVSIHQTCLPQNTSVSTPNSLCPYFQIFLTRYFVDVPLISQNKSVSKVNFSIIHLVRTMCELTSSVIQTHYTDNFILFTSAKSRSRSKTAEHFLQKQWTMCAINVLWSASLATNSHLFASRFPYFLETLCPHFEKYEHTSILPADFCTNTVKYGWAGRSVFTHLGHECQELLSPCNGMHVCTDQTSVYTLLQKSFGGMASEPMLTPRTNSLYQKNSSQRKIKPTMLHQAGQQAKHPTNELFQPQKATLKLHFSDTLN